MLMMVCIMLFTFVACGSEGDDNSSGGGSGGSGDACYAHPLITSFPITENGYGYYTNYIIAHVDELFDSEGRYGGYINLPDGTLTHGPAYGRDEIEVMHIINSNTIEFYEGYLYKCGASGTRGRTLLYKVTGSSLGDVGYYASLPDYYNYTRDGNVIKVKVENSTETFTITNDGLLKSDGEKCPKFNLGQTFVDNSSNESSSAEDIAEAQSISKTASVVGTPTFHRVTFKCTFSSSSSGGNGNYQKVFAYSKNRSDLENANEMARRYHKFDGSREVHQTDSYEASIEPGKVHDLSNGYFEDGDLRFVDEQIADLSNIIAEYDELNVTVYYCPVIMVSDKALIGDIKSVALRELKQTSGFVDLGLSCKWSATNNRASSPWDFGSSITLLSKNISGEGRLPTKEEVLELNKCQLEVIDNGILIKGTNGNEIFLPCRDTEGKTIYPGYGTSSTQTSGSSKYDVLYSFDTSTHKFTTSKSSSAINFGQYTMHTDAYVRPVIDGSGGGGNGEGTQTSNVMILKDFLQRPLGTVDADFATSSFSDIVQVLQTIYSVPSSENVFVLDDGYNPSLENLKYLGVGILDFLSLIGTDVIDYCTFYDYGFSVKKDGYWDENPYSLFLAIKEEFAYLGIKLTENPTPYNDFYNSIAEAVYFDYSSNIEYFVELYEMDNDLYVTIRITCYR